MAKPIVLSEGEGATNYPPHPPGQFASSCIDIVEHNGVETKFGIKDRIQLRFHTGHMETVDGEPVPIYLDCFFNKSFHPDSRLRQFLESWRGQPFNEEERKRFVLDTLLGVNAYVQVVHNPTEKKTYANIKTIMRLPQGIEPAPSPVGYVRIEDREDKEAESGGDKSFGHSATDPDDDLPF